jgi:hypothetical protein
VEGGHLGGSGCGWKWITGLGEVSRRRPGSGNDCDVGRCWQSSGVGGSVPVGMREAACLQAAVVTACRCKRACAGIGFALPTTAHFGLPYIKITYDNTAVVNYDGWNWAAVDKLNLRRTTLDRRMLYVIYDGEKGHRRLNNFQGGVINIFSRCRLNNLQGGHHI